MYTCLWKCYRKKKRMKRPQHRNLRSHFLVYCRRIMWIIVSSVPSLQMDSHESLKKTWNHALKTGETKTSSPLESSEGKKPSHNPSYSCCWSPLVRMCPQTPGCKLNESVLFSQQQNPVMVLSLGCDLGSGSSASSTALCFRICRTV